MKNGNIFIDKDGTDIGKIDINTRNQVLRNYIESGKNEKISDADFAELDKKSKKFAKLHAEEA